MTPSRTIAGAAATALFAAALFAAPADPPRRVRAAMDAIRTDEAYAFVKALASPEFAGRLTGDPGYTAAAKWAAARFGSWGLRGLGKAEGYLQAYPSPCTVVDKAEMTVFVAKPPAEPAGRGAQAPPAAGQPVTYDEMKLVPEKDFLPLLYTDTAARTGDLVFAGWGISAPDLGYDDYAGIDVKGKFVLCFRGTPDRDPKWTVHDEHRTRMAAANARGALGIVYIYSEIASNPNGDWIAGFTPAMVSDGVADRILKETGSTAADLRKALGLYKRPISFPLRSRLKVDFVSRHDPKAVGYNVVAWIEGSDPKLRREVVVVGGHFDHTGRHMGLLFPGADDNASGSAVVMETAHAFSRLSPAPKRSVAFVLFGGEEMGLQGSSWFADHLPAPFEKVAGMLNFDMLGEGDGFWGGASAEPADFRKAIEQADAGRKMLRGLGVIREVGVRGSDYAPFFAKGIPSASFGSNGPHLAYHQTGDTVYRINPDIMADGARLAFDAALAWADR